MNVAKRHPKDGRRRMDYVASKITHMRRQSLVTGSSEGVGMHGVAAPDWLFQEQTERKKKEKKI